MSLLFRFWSKLIGKRNRLELEKEKIEFLRELLAMEESKETMDFQEYIKNIAKDFMLDSLIVARRDGSIIASTGDSVFEKMLERHSLYDFVNSEFPDTDHLIVKDKDGYNIICPEKEHVYLIRSSGEISTLEIKKIIERLEQRIGLGI